MKTSELYEYFNGELPPHECERVLAWAAASEANSRQYERVKEEYFMARLATRPGADLVFRRMDAAFSESLHKY